DVQALTDAGVILCSTPKALRRPMAVAIIAYILNLSLHFMDKQKLAHEGRWGYRLSMGVGLVGKTLGSIGAGGIGHEMFRLAKPFDMKHIATTRTMNQEAVADVDVRLVDLGTLFKESDFLIINCPLNKETHHLIGEKELRKMKKTAFMINITRGSIVNEAALVKALQQGWIQGAGLDVFEQEPTPIDNPLLSMENVIVTPHCAGSTDEAWMNKWEENLQQISTIIHGELPECVNPEVWSNPEFQVKLKRMKEAIG
ncbi:MAG: NAD(P)-dependent oxidoreductase, partial [Nitrosomonadaceae bacterium]